MYIYIERERGRDSPQDGVVVGDRLSGTNNMPLIMIYEYIVSTLYGDIDTTDGVVVGDRALPSFRQPAFQQLTSNQRVRSSRFKCVLCFE